MSHVNLGIIFHGRNLSNQLTYMGIYGGVIKGSATGETNPIREKGSLVCNYANKQRRLMLE